MDVTEDYSLLFNRLQSFYILITIHDIQQYNCSELAALAHRLQSQLALDAHLQQIHEDLTQKSDHNVAEKKRKKKEKKQALLEPQPQKKKEEFTVDTLPDPEGSFINESMILSDLQEEKWKVTDCFRGVIYDGKLLIKLRTCLQGSKEKQLMGFYVCSESKKSVVVRKCLWGPAKGKEKNMEVVLVVESKKHSFAVAQEGNNVIGLDFLKNHNVVLLCNYRAEHFNFQLQFTL